MSKTEAFNEAVRIASAKLADANFAENAGRLGFSLESPDTILVRILGGDCTVSTKNFEVIDKVTGKAVKPEVRILVLHYLLCESTPSLTGKLISFRELPGGQFYYGPFQSRSVNIVASVIKNDLERLRKNFVRFDLRKLELGDLSAEIHVIGKVYATFVYRTGDEEFPASAELFFDSSIKGIFSTEDVTFIASLISRRLL